MMLKDLPLTAEVKQVEPLTQSILRVFLAPQHYVPYEAGQYLQILMADEALSFSIANAPLGAHQYELHIRHCPDNPHHQHLMQEMRSEGELPIYVPLGECHVSRLDINKPTLMIVQGTGFAPVKAILEQWLSDGQLPPTLLCWLTRSPSDCYMQPLVEMWDEHVEHFQSMTMGTDCSEQRILETLLRESRFDKKNMQVVLAGPFERMTALRQSGIEMGLSKAQFFSDAFTAGTDNLAP